MTHKEQIEQLKELGWTYKLVPLGGVTDPTEGWH